MCAHAVRPPPDPILDAIRERLQQQYALHQRGARFWTAYQGLQLELVRGQPGFLGAESTRDGEGFGITVAYFEDESSICGWREHIEHAQTRQRGRDEWYRHFEVRVAKVERAYGWDRGDA